MPATSTTQVTEPTNVFMSALYLHTFPNRSGGLLQIELPGDGRNPYRPKHSRRSAWKLTHCAARCFYINLPIGGVAGVLLFFFLRTPTPDVPKLPAVEIIKDLDPQGCILFLAGIVCLIQALEWGGVMHPWSDWRLIVLLVFFGVGYKMNVPSSHMYSLY